MMAQRVGYERPEGFINKLSLKPEIIKPSREIGFQLGWNEENKLWKPYLLLELWWWQIQVGWLWE